MHPLLFELSKKFDKLATRAEVLDAIADLEDAYDSFNELEQETASGLIEELNRRLADAR